MHLTLCQEPLIVSKWAEMPPALSFQFSVWEGLLLPFSIACCLLCTVLGLCSTYTFSPITCLYLYVCAVWLRDGVRGRESENVCVCLFTYKSLCVWWCVCVSTSHSSACFPLRISCIIYEPLMNMLISRRAGRGERASPVLFLHSSDEGGPGRGMEKRHWGKNW